MCFSGKAGRVEVGSVESGFRYSAASASNTAWLDRSNAGKAAFRAATATAVCRLCRRGFARSLACLGPPGIFSVCGMMGTARPDFQQFPEEVLPADC
jgi:hypothetical protein